MANITEISRKGKTVGMTTTAIGFTGDFTLAGGIRNLYDKMHTQDLWSTNTLKKKQYFAKDRSSWTVFYITHQLS